MTTLAFFINGPANLKEMMIANAPDDFYVPVQPTLIYSEEGSPSPTSIIRKAKYLRAMPPIWQPEYRRYYVEYVFQRIVGDIL